MILQFADPQLIKWCLGFVREGAEEAGKDWSTFHVMSAAPALLRTISELARAQVRWFPAMVSNHVVDLVSKYPLMSSRLSSRCMYESPGLRLSGAWTRRRAPRRIRHRRSGRSLLRDRLAGTVRRTAARFDRRGRNRVQHLPDDREKERTLEVYGKGSFPLLWDDLAAWCRVILAINPPRYAACPGRRWRSPHGPRLQAE